MGTFLYFAYGSNMLTERLQKRCPSAKPAGTAVARGYRMCFSKKSNKDNSGKATLIEDKNEKTHGVLFKIDKKELDDLDQAEGCGRGYIRCSSFMVMRVDNNQEETAITYLGKPENGLIPYDWYRALVLAGAIQHELPDSYVETLCKHSVKRDPNSCRPSRLEALNILERTGFQYLASECSA